MQNQKLDLNYVFVYGTLKKGFTNHCVIENSLFLGNATVKGQLLDLGVFPGLIGSNDQKGKDKVSGEVYIADNKTLAELDILESEGSLYLRKSVVASILAENWQPSEQQELFKRTVWVYFWNGSKKYPHIPNGYWGYVKRAKVK